MIAYTYTFYTRYSKILKKKVYYARFRDPDTGKRMNGISTGQTSLNEAKLWCDKFLKQGKFTEKSKRKFKEIRQRESVSLSLNPNPEGLLQWMSSAVYLILK